MSLVHGELNSADLCVDDSGISLFDEDSPMFHELDQITQLAESGAIVLTETERKILDTLWKIRENPANLDLYREDLFPKEGERSALLSGEFKGGVFDGLKSLFTKVKFNGTVRVKVFSEHEIALVKEANDNKPRNPGWNGALRREEIESIRRSYRSASFGAKSVEEDLHLAHVRALKLSQEEGSLKEDFELI